MKQIRVQVAIAGAGLAGMALALRLARRGHRVALLERRSRPGGAVHTVPGPHGGMDNSVHLFLQAFTRCRALLEEIGALAELRMLEAWACVALNQRLIRLPMGKGVLASLPDLLRLGPPRALGLGRGVLRVLGTGEPPRGTAFQWLQGRGMAASTFEARFWQEWSLGVFNTPLDQVDAGLFSRTARTLFSQSRLQRPLVAASTLEQLWILPLERALDRAGVQLVTASPVVAARRSPGRLTAFQATELQVEAEHFVWAAPPHEMYRVTGLAELAPSFPPHGEGLHIVNLRLPVEQRPASTPGLRGWFDEAFQWLFDAPGGEAVLVGSAWTDAHLAERHRMEARLPKLLALHGMKVAGSARWLVQRHATPLQSPAHEAARPGVRTALENMWLCGAWVDTGLPASMEGALAGAEACFAALDSALE